MVTLLVISIFYIIRQYKKYNSVHTEECSKDPDFISIYDMNDEGWQKTVHPVHLQYDSDEESQIIGPMHEKYRQSVNLPSVITLLDSHQLHPLGFPCCSMQSFRYRYHFQSFYLYLQH